MMRAGTFMLMLCSLTFGCSIGEIGLGSNVVWSSSFESGTLDDWFRAPAGGTVVDVDAPQPVVTDELVHCGKHSAQLSSDGLGTGLWRALEENAMHYGAWFYVAPPTVPNDEVTLVQFATREGDLPATTDKSIRLLVRTAASGQLVLHVFDDRPPYLGLPLDDVPAVAMPERWFHLEVRFAAGNANDSSMLVWLDGRLVYSIESRPLDLGMPMYFAVVCAVDAERPAPYRVFVDDVVIASSPILSGTDYCD
jgi:hypothetical protein